MERLATAAWQKLNLSLYHFYERKEADRIVQLYFEDRFSIKAPLGDRRLSKDQGEQFEQDAQRLLAGEPLQYVVGQAYFYGMMLDVNPAVLIPRQETEELVAWILETVQSKDQILDIGTGSGCIPLALKKERADLKVFGLDVSQEALAVAQGNAEKQQLSVHWLKKDILNPRHWKDLGIFDVIVSNPPYVLSSERAALASRVSNFEPEIALFVPEDDALLFYEEIALFAATHLVDGGQLFFEIHAGKGAEVVELLERQGFQDIELRQDLNGRDRMVRAKLH